MMTRCTNLQSVPHASESLAHHVSKGCAAGHVVTRCFVALLKTRESKLLHVRGNTHTQARTCMSRGGPGVCGNTCTPTRGARPRACHGQGHH